MKYARLERERRFLLAGLPELAAASVTVSIHDRYLRGTRLRLRLVEQPGRPPVRKLGQKIRLDAGSPSVIAHTSLYLDAEEYEVLARLPADPLSKTRTSLDWDGRQLAVDCFVAELAGLVLAEVELPEPDPGAATEPAADPKPAEPAGWPPVPVLAEVTGDERFTGAALATTSAAELSRLLEALGAGRPEGYFGS